MDRASPPRLGRRWLGWFLAAAWGVMNATGAGAENRRAPSDGVRLGSPMVLTQLPAGSDPQRIGPASGRMLRTAYGQGGRLLLVLPDGAQRVLSRGFHSACDPEVSFDGTRILFAGKRTEADRWNIYEMGVDGSPARQITRDLGDCRSPTYQSTLYTLDSPGPWYQITLVSNAAGRRNEFGSDPATDLYSCKLDGSEVRRLTFNPSSDFDPFLMPDGRVLFASWQRHGLELARPKGTVPFSSNENWDSPPRISRGRIGLFGVNLDGTDYARFAADEGRPIKQMPCITSRGVVVFVEADDASWDGAGWLSCVSMRRPLHSYRQITGPSDGLFHSPSPLPDGRILVSRRPAAGVKTHGVYRFDPSTGKVEPVFDDPAYHDIQAKLVSARPEPDGHSSVVSEDDPNGRLYCLDVYISDLPEGSKMARGSVKRLRVLEAVVPRAAGDGAAGVSPGKLPPPAASSTSRSAPAGLPRRSLGEVSIGQNGSFNVQVPANTPLELQLLDADGRAIRSCGWIWTKNHESRGCIGCHEDGELTPENVPVTPWDDPANVLIPPKADDEPGNPSAGASVTPGESK